MQVPTVEAKDLPAKWSVVNIGRQPPQPVTHVKTSVTVISDKERSMEIRRMEMDRILFWNA